MMQLTADNSRNNPVIYGGANTTSAGRLIAGRMEQTSGPFLVTAPTYRYAEQLKDSIAFWSGQEPALFPELPVNPYNLAEVPVTLLAKWLRGWHSIRSGLCRCAVMTPLMAAFPPLSPQSVELKQGEVFDRDRLITFLADNGYRRTALCEEWGDCAVRGGIIDIFPPNLDDPMRVEWEGDRIHSLRIFSPEDQRTREELPSIIIIAFTLLSEPERKDLTATLRDRVTGLGGDRLVSEMEDTGSPGSLALYYPLVSELKNRTGDFFSVHYDSEAVAGKVQSIFTELLQEYSTSNESGYLNVAPGELFPTLEAPAAPELSFEMFRSSESARVIPNEGVAIVKGSIPTFAEEVKQLLKREYTVTVVCQSSQHRRMLNNYLDEQEIRGVSWADGKLHESWVNPDHREAWIPDSVILGAPTTPRVKQKAHQAYRLLLDQIKEKDPIVHVEHGVGRFLGLNLIDGDDYVLINYSDGQLFVPMESLDLLTSYVGVESERAPLHSLGGKVWKTQKRKARQVADSIVKELAEHYAERQISVGVAFPEDDDLQKTFEYAFPFDETEDQERVILEVKEDMQTAKPMDRLICGDVGFGKTEVALRAAFKAVFAGKQVAILSPTTVLAYQHYRTFIERFSSFPVRVAWVSRFISHTRQKEILESVSYGDVDIVIGTHRLLSKDVEFHDLGLLIIDEEQRFGVSQKEKIRALKKNLDVLAMSATPIPRTLYMSLMEIRDLSVINTPPRGRLSVETSVTSFNPTLIRDAVLYEIERKGQVFFIHNRVQEIPRILHFLDELLPEVEKVVTHGQMNETELEKNLLAFVQGKVPLLLTTTIIENGIDIPRANTMIVNNAHNFGLSQLYQLRGRIGRSTQQAHCYLMVPSLHLLGDQAKDRLSALEEFSQLGSGFKIAARDLDIRGAGNLLGVEQHGHVESIGYELFCRMVDKAARELKGDILEEIPPVTLSLGLPLAIPSTYISDEMERLSIYRKLLKGDVERVREECIDRFGPITKEVELLFKVYKFRKHCEALKIISVALSERGVSIQFHPSTPVKLRKLVDYVQTLSGAALSPHGELFLPVSDEGERLLPVLTDFLTSLTESE